MKLRFLEELNSLYSPTAIDTRGENAWGVAVKFLTLLQEQIPEEAERRKLMNAWMKSVKENDYRKFKRALNRYERVRSL
jgi:hypothetical protein